MTFTFKVKGSTVNNFTIFKYFYVSWAASASLTAPSRIKEKMCNLKKLSIHHKSRFLYHLKMV